MWLWYCKVPIVGTGIVRTKYGVGHGSPHGVGHGVRTSCTSLPLSSILRPLRKLSLYTFWGLAIFRCLLVLGFIRSQKLLTNVTFGGSLLWELYRGNKHFLDECVTIDVNKVAHSECCYMYVFTSSYF